MPAEVSGAMLYRVNGAGYMSMEIGTMERLRSAIESEGIEWVLHRSIYWDWLRSQNNALWKRFSDLADSYRKFDELCAKLHEELPDA